MTTTPIGRSVIAGATRPYGHLTTTPPEAITRYMLDPFAHCDDGHVKTLDLVTMEVVEFHPWPHQRSFVADWIDLERLAASTPEEPDLVFSNVHEEKSRQEGFTTLFSYIVWWLLAYHQAPGGYQHMDIEEVDDGGRSNSIKSFFGKIRWVNEQMPDRYRAPLRFRGGNAPSIRHAFRPLAFVLGEGATPDPARGGRLRWFLQDEAARLPFDKAATAALSRAVPIGRVMNSTPMGEDNEYFRIREERPKGWKMRRDHWSTHPVYSVGLHVAGSRPDACPQCRGNTLRLRWTPADPDVAHRYPGKLTSPWYDAAVIELTDEQVAAELDIDYAGSLEARVYPEFSVDQHVADAASIRRRGLDPAAPWDKNLHDFELSWDYGADTTAVGVWQDAPTEYRKIGELEVHDMAPEEVVDALLETLADLGVPLRLLGSPFLEGMLAVGDPAGEAKQQATARSLVSDYRRLGIQIRSRPQRVARTINAVKGLLLGRPKPLVVFGPTCPLTIKHFKGNRWPVDRHGRRKPGTHPPENDEHNHMMRADAYLITWKFPPVDPEDAIRDATAAEAERREARLGGAIFEGDLPDLGVGGDTGLRPDMGL